MPDLSRSDEVGLNKRFCENKAAFSLLLFGTTVQKEKIGGYEKYAALKNFLRFLNFQKLDIIIIIRGKEKQNQSREKILVKLRKEDQEFLEVLAELGGRAIHGNVDRILAERRKRQLREFSGLTSLTWLKNQGLITTIKQGGRLRVSLTTKGMEVVNTKPIQAR